MICWYNNLKAFSKIVYTRSGNFMNRLSRQFCKRPWDLPPKAKAWTINIFYQSKNAGSFCRLRKEPRQTAGRKGELNQMDFRHEYKHEISRADLFVLRQRLRAVAQPDPHAVNGAYRIRSLYFDNAADKALREKLDGVSRREKFRIRCYDNDLSVIRLEKKSKLGGLGSKQSANLTAQQAQAIVDGDCGWMAQSENALVRELHCKMQTQGLRPKTIVEYTREPFIFAPGNVRVTLDHDIRTGLSAKNFLDPGCVTIPAGDAPVLLEVKWDEFLPDIIRDAVSLPGRRMAAFSKYAQCRIYG